MKVRVDDITDKVLHFAAEDPVADYAQISALVAAGECTFLAPLRYSLAVVREYDHIKVSANFQTAVRLACSRCLCEYDTSLESSFTLIYSKSHGLPLDEEIELGEQDLISISYDGSEIDFSPVIEEQVIMEIPFKPLCGEDCLGLCSSCGANLNNAPCDCDRRDVSFKMSALKKLTIEK